MTTVGESTLTGHRLALKALLIRSEIVDGDGPPHPAAALLLACTHCLSEDRFFCGWVIEDLHNLDVTRAGQRQDAIAGAEAGMDSAVDEGGSQDFAEASGVLIETCGASGEHEMVDVHGNIVPFVLPTMKSAPRLAAVMRSSITVHCDVGTAHLAPPSRYRLGHGRLSTCLTVSDFLKRRPRLPQSPPV